MNILFITPSEVQPLNGGIERTTYALSQALLTYHGHVCYFRSLEDGYTEQQWENYILEQAIDVIVAQGANKRITQLLPMLRHIVNRAERKIVLLFVFHSNPGVELITMDYTALFNRIIHGIDIKANLQQLAMQLSLPITRKAVQNHLRKKYRIPYDYADKIVLLSSRYIPEYCSIAGVNEDKFEAIPNMLPLQIKPYTGTKKKIVLLVSRMEERQKRIKLALRIWSNTPHDGWQLKILGKGEDLDYYKWLMKKWHMSDISFEGQQNPIPYYNEASIFIMTSSCEGLPMTILEARQCGCVPIVFNTFSSLPDIVTDGENGFVVKEGDEQQYVARLTELMNNEQMRRKMLENVESSIKRFAPQTVAAQWNTLFNELVNK